MRRTIISCVGGSNWTVRDESGGKRATSASAIRRVIDFATARRAMRALTLCALIVASGVAFHPSAVATAQDGTKSREELIFKALDRRVGIEFLSTPLMEFPKYLQECIGDQKIQFVALWAELVKENCGPCTPITVTARDVRVRSALGLVLDPLDLDWTIENEVVLITTKEHAAKHMLVRVYNVDDLVTTDADCVQTCGYEQLLEMVQSQIAPTSWDRVGGPGSVTPFTRNGARLVISQTARNHFEIADLLEQLRGSLAAPRVEQPPDVAK